MRLINKLAYCLAVAIPLATLAGCSGSSGSSPGTNTASGPPPEESSITIDAVPTADATGLYIAYDEGLFAKQHLNVTIDTIDGGEFGIGDLQSGKVQLVEGNYVSFILAQIAGKFAAPNPADPAKTLASRPIDMRIIANTSQMEPGTQALYVLPGSPYRTVADLVRHHATIGINSPNNIAQVLLGALFAADGLKFSAIRQVVQPVAPSSAARNGCGRTPWTSRSCSASRTRCSSSA